MFEQVSYTVAETGGSPVEACVQLQGQLAIPVTVNVVFQEGTATSADYSNTDLSYTFSNDSDTSQCFVLLIIDDGLLEDNESFNVSLSSQQDVVTLVNSTTEVVVQDTSVLTVGFESAAYTITEGGSTLVCARIFNGSLAEQFVLPLSIISASEQGM